MPNKTKFQGSLFESEDIQNGGVENLVVNDFPDKNLGDESDISNISDNHNSFERPAANSTEKSTKSFAKLDDFDSGLIELIETDTETEENQAIINKILWLTGFNSDYLESTNLVKSNNDPKNGVFSDDNIVDNLGNNLGNNLANGLGHNSANNSPKINFSEIAILFRNHNHLGSLIVDLNQAGIPFNYQKGDNVLENAHIIQIFKLLSFAESLYSPFEIEQEDILWEILCWDFWGLDEVELYRLAAKMRLIRKQKKDESSDLGDSEAGDSKNNTTGYIIKNPEDSKSAEAAENREKNTSQSSGNEGLGSSAISQKKPTSPESLRGLGEAKNFDKGGLGSESLNGQRLGGGTLDKESNKESNQNLKEFVGEGLDLGLDERLGELLDGWREELKPKFRLDRVFDSEEFDPKFVFDACLAGHLLPDNLLRTFLAEMLTDPNPHFGHVAKELLKLGAIVKTESFEDALQAVLNLESLDSESSNSGVSNLDNWDLDTKSFNSGSFSADKNSLISQNSIKNAPKSTDGDFLFGESDIDYD